MVRQIRACTTCSRRFIALYVAQYHCCSCRHQPSTTTDFTKNNNNNKSPKKKNAVVINTTNTTTKVQSPTKTTTSVSSTVTTTTKPLSTANRMKKRRRSCHTGGSCCPVSFTTTTTTANDIANSQQQQQQQQDQNMQRTSSSSFYSTSFSSKNDRCIDDNKNNKNNNSNSNVIDLLLLSSDTEDDDEENNDDNNKTILNRKTLTMMTTSKSIDSSTICSATPSTNQCSLDNVSQKQQQQPQQQQREHEQPYHQLCTAITTTTTNSHAATSAVNDTMNNHIINHEKEDEKENNTDEKNDTNHHRFCYTAVNYGTKQQPTDSNRDSTTTTTGTTNDCCMDDIENDDHHDIDHRHHHYNNVECTPNSKEYDNNNNNQMFENIYEKKSFCNWSDFHDNDDNDDDDDDSNKNNSDSMSEKQKNSFTCYSDGDDDLEDDDHDVDDDDDEPLMLSDLLLLPTVTAPRRNDVLLQSSSPTSTTIPPSNEIVMKIDNIRTNEEIGLDPASNCIRTSIENDECHQQTNTDTVERGSNPIAAATAAASTTTTTICWICGSDLFQLLQRSGAKGRVQHMKRCSKRHNVVLNDLRCNDDDDTLTLDGPCCEAAPSTAAIESAAVEGFKNPYNKEQQQNWHNNPTSNARTTTAGSLSAKTSVSINRSSTITSSKDVNTTLMANAKRKAKIAAIQTTTARGVNNNAATDSNKNNLNQRQRRYPTNNRKDIDYTNRSYEATTMSRNCPKYKMIAGTDFCCDGFHYANAQLTKNYFLTHFHSDHYGGITKHWNIGTIYCSIPTANLVHTQLGVSKQFIHPLPLYTPTIIVSGTGQKAVTVTLLNANHCPGAIMFLFEIGTRTILHVGDFRWNYSIMSSQQYLRPFCRKPWTSTTENQQLNATIVATRRIDDLYLDTTYCDEQYSLPTQSECINAVIKVFEEAMNYSNAKKLKFIFLFGAFTIGKEAVYMSVAKRFHLKVYVDQRRYRILSSLGWSPEEISLLTTEPTMSNLWVVPLGHINMKRMSSYKTIKMKNFSREYDHVIGFRPTGWTLSKGSNTNVIGTTTKGCMTLHTVPYSEHSSFPELVECLESLNPKRIITTVNTGKSQQQIDLLMKHWRFKQENVFVRNQSICTTKHKTVLERQQRDVFRFIQ